MTLVIAVPLAIGLGVYAGSAPGPPRRSRNRGHHADRHFAARIRLGQPADHLFAFWLQWLPPSSLMDAGDSMFEHFKLLILPVLTLTLVMLAYTSRMTRTSMIDVMERNFIRTARLKGIGERQVILRHALPNALLPTITIVAMNIGWLMGSLVIVETVFSYPGPRADDGVRGQQPRRADAADDGAADGGDLLPGQPGGRRAVCVSESAGAVLMSATTSSRRKRGPSGVKSMTLVPPPGTQARADLLIGATSS